jgi:ABC transport system ATP-binding/permease protein
MPAMWKLVIEDDEGKRTVVPLSREDYTIGRQEGNTIRLTERNVSRQHSRIRRKRANGAGSDSFVIEDRESYNGVFVNGLRVAHAQDLQHGDLVQIGDYRIVLQDDVASAVETAAMPAATEHDAKATLQMAAYRGQTLTDRPNRLVMLVGPTPGVEYPLGGERMSIGRAEDASISVNHNSVSRLHCEIQALGDGRFEIVDKGSSNGVRVNAVELRRSIIEAGDVIELGDVRFKFVGAGQVFVAGPNESQQLTAISDRDAELAEPRRKGLGGYAVPIVGAGLVGAMIIIGFVYVLRTRASTDAVIGPITAPKDAEQALVVEAKSACTLDDCEASHQRVTSELPPSSPWRNSADFQQIEATWADSLLRRAQAETDIDRKRALLRRVAGADTVDAFRRRTAADQLAALEEPVATPSELPIADAREPVTEPAAPRTPPPTPTPTPAPSPTRRPEPTARPTVATAAASPPGPTATAPPTTPKAQVSHYDRAQKAVFEGRPAEARQILETKVRSGHGTPDEVRLLRALCKSPPDPGCLEDIRAKY